MNEISCIKEKDINLIIQALNKVENRVDEVILFGSCLDEKKCRENSDIDLCIISRVESSELLTNDMANVMEYADEHGFYCPLDILTYKNRDEIEKKADKNKRNVEHTIISKGITIYKKEGN